MNKKGDTYRINTNWKAWAIDYLKAILMIPLLGYGIYKLLQIKKKQDSIFFEITNDDIAKTVNGKRTAIKLAFINEIKIFETGIDKRLGVARLYISSGDQEILIPGLEQAHTMENILESAVAQEKKRYAHHQELEKKRPTHAPGTLEKMNDLIGMWQQGLLTDEQLAEERKKFE